VPNIAKVKPVNIGLSNSFAFGGLNAVIAVKTPQ
jgi:3-oxoacyl-(acyl-carrier-protein) synthase